MICSILRVLSSLECLKQSVKLSTLGHVERPHILATKEGLQAELSKLGSARAARLGSAQLEL